jgi:hypothetical protein
VRSRLVTVLACAAAVATMSAGCGSSTKEAPPPSAPVGVPTAPASKQLAPPPQAFNPNGNAEDGKAALESQGYSVVIQNSGGGDPGKRNPLSQCRITSVDGLRGDAPPPNTTVYLTVAC